MRFYVPEWDDRVDADYDFLHDEHSTLGTDDRDLAYIWDLFDRSETPIDGVLLSREQAEESSSKSQRLTENGIYGASKLDLPDWLPTISDCGAWGYKSLPFPPYDNAEMLEFYEALDVTTGVTIDHLVLGAGHTSRLYLDKRALGQNVSKSDLPETLSDEVDLMIDTWPDFDEESARTWPSYVEQEEPSIYGVSEVDPFVQSDFDGSPAEIIERLQDDPRAVYRDDDMQYRYDLALRNATDMRDLYEQGEYSFRLMAAIQGWDAESYVSATEQVLEMGFDYVGIGGVAGSPQSAVESIVSGIGAAIKQFEREHTTRIDTHVFGFAKTGAFETIGRSGVTSFDSASMLRAAWTGGDNYHLDSDERYDALRVRYPTHRDDIETAIEKALRGQEMLYALRAFDVDKSIAEALRTWHTRAQASIDGIKQYLRAHRHDERYDVDLVRDAEQAFRSGYEHGRAFRANVGDPVSSVLVKLLRGDDPDDPTPFSEYLDVLAPVYELFDDWTPTQLAAIESQEDGASVGSFEALWPLVETYATSAVIDDGNLLSAYERLLRATPWKRCPCSICQEQGIEVAIFRGNNRNRRRGFHNTRRFYDQFEEELPKTLVVTKASPALLGSDSIEAHLRDERPDFWEAVHDLPVAEVGAVTAEGFHEWWMAPPSTVSFAPDRMADAVLNVCERYQDLVVDAGTLNIDKEIEASLSEVDCRVHRAADANELRDHVLDRLGYENDYVPSPAIQAGLGDY